MPAKARKEPISTGLSGCNRAPSDYIPRTFKGAAAPLMESAPFMLISPAYAQTAGGGGAGIIELILPFALIFIIMYFLILRPQRQQAKRREEMLKAIRRGDTVVTNGGIIGKVTKVVDDHEVELQIAEGVKVRAARGLIAEVRTKAEPVAGATT